jgi:MFS family permease
MGVQALCPRHERNAMTAPDPYATPAPTTDQAAHADNSRSSLLRAAIWVAIGALIAVAIVCVLWVLLGSRDANDIVGRAFLTILLLAAFAGVAILDAHLAPSRPAWFALASMGSWVVALLLGAIMIWMPERFPWLGFSRFIQFLLIVLILQLVLLHVRFYLKAFQRYETPFTRTVTIITITLVIALAVLLIIPLAFGEWLALAGIYWRIVVAIAILAALGTALVPLVNVLFAPKKVRAPLPHAPLAAPAGPALAVSAAPAAQELLPWPTYVDAVTPLPMLPDGSPDWNAYYTGYPSPGAHVFTPIEPAAQVEPPAAPAQPVAPAEPTQKAGYEGYPPPPPLPPLPPRA